MKVRFLFIGFLHGSSKKGNENIFYAVGHILNNDGVPSCSLTWIEDDVEYLKTLKPLTCIDCSVSINGKYVSYSIIHK